MPGMTAPLIKTAPKGARPGPAGLSGLAWLQDLLRRRTAAQGFQSPDQTQDLRRRNDFGFDDVAQISRDRQNVGGNYQGRFMGSNPTARNTGANLDSYRERGGSQTAQVQSVRPGANLDQYQERGGSTPGMVVSANRGEFTDPNDGRLGSSGSYGGFAGELAPGMLGSIIEDPDQLLYEWLKYATGAQPSDLMMERYGDLPDVARYLFALMNPESNLNDTSNDTTAEMLNWISTFLDQQSTAGGRMPDTDTMLRNLVNSGSMSAEQAEGSNNSLYELLSGGSAQDQIKAYATYASGAIQALNPGAQQAVLNRLQRWAREWLSIANADPESTVTFGEFVDSKGGIFGVG